MIAIPVYRSWYKKLVSLLGISIPALRFFQKISCEIINKNIILFVIILKKMQIMCMN